MSVVTTILITYGVVALLMLRPAVGHFAWKEANGYNQLRPDSGDWRDGVLWGALFSALWPVLLVGIACIALANRTLPTVGAERAAERKIRERRLRELERELELDR